MDVNPREWQLTSDALRLGHRLGDPEYRFRCRVCKHNIRTILDQRIPCRSPYDGKYLFSGGPYDGEWLATTGNPIWVLTVARPLSVGLDDPSRDWDYTEVTYELRRSTLNQLFVGYVYRG